MPDTHPVRCSASRTYEGGLGPEFEALLHRIDDRETAEAWRGLRNMALAPTLAIYQALQAGEEVPVELLNQSSVRRYALKRFA